MCCFSLISAQTKYEVLSECLLPFRDCQQTPTKSSLGVKEREREKEHLIYCLKIKESKLPVRYLVVPLILQKLTIEDSGSLLDKILGWLRNFLLLGGCRLQLLSSIQVFWASIFILPKKIIKLLVQ
jgi:hypothetical protein